MNIAEIRAIRYELINLLEDKMCINKHWALEYSEKDLMAHYGILEDDRDMKPCIFCSGSKLINARHLDLYIDKKKLNANITIADDKYFLVEKNVIHINYCPICGRHLPFNIRDKDEERRGSGNEQPGIKTEVKRDEEVSVSY